MKIKLLTNMASPDRISFAGDVIEVADEEGYNLIIGNYAQLIEPDANIKEAYKQMESEMLSGGKEQEIISREEIAPKPRGRRPGK